MSGRRDLIYTTDEGVEIYTIPGTKEESPFDFRLMFKQPEKRLRTPKHIHLIVEMYVKHAYMPELTLRLRDHLLNVYDSLKPINYYPPKLQYFEKSHIKKFEELNKVGEFSVEFILATTELIMIQEKTNYPDGSLTQELYKAFGVKDRFYVINTATLQRMRG
ncbi:MAG: hypothetical protein HY930_05070 [Euryarchaeota archaeon]|nr:hypothetical protein [Euryarchaeota archaeon]